MNEARFRCSYPLLGLRCWSVPQSKIPLLIRPTNYMISRSWRQVLLFISFSKMFTGIQSLFFGKKHHKHRADDSTEDKPHASDDFVILERRHSGDFDKNSGIYPNLDPSNPTGSNLPYAISPSLPNLKDAVSEEAKEDTKVDMLQGVPFVLSSQLLLFDENSNKSLLRIMKTLNDLKEGGDESFLESYMYDYELEHTISAEYDSGDA